MGERNQLVEGKKEEETDWGEKRTGGGQDWGRRGESREKAVDGHQSQQTLEREKRK
jgi:hypothetical protein